MRNARRREERRRQSDEPDGAHRGDCDCRRENQSEHGHELAWLHRLAAFSRNSAICADAKFHQNPEVGIGAIVGGIIDVTEMRRSVRKK
jgi:hypothetical protein